MSKVKFQRLLAFYTKFEDFLDMNTLIQMYHSFVFPYLIYCVKTWGNASAIHLDPFKKKFSSNNLFRILGSFRTTFPKKQYSKF